MKLTHFALIALTLITGAAQAESWQKIMTCEGGAVTIDVNGDERRQLQIVFRGVDMLRRMRDAGIISPNFGDTESLLRGVHFGGFRQVTATETQPEWLGGVFYPWDLRKIYIDRGSAGANEVEVRGSTILVKKYGINQGTSCPDWNDMECRGGVYHKTYVFSGEVALSGCQTH